MSLGYGKVTGQQKVSTIHYKILYVSKYSIGYFKISVLLLKMKFESNQQSIISAQGGPNKECP